MTTEKIIFEIMGWAGHKTEIRLLQALDQTGSINKAAQMVGLQYKSAWQKLDRINNILPYPLILKTTGGTGGGGTLLTQEGKELLDRIGLLQKEFSQFTQFFSDNPQQALQTLKTLRRIEMKLSARNVWLGKVVEIHQGAVNTVVGIKLKGGDMISTVITDNSVKRLELEPGKEVIAIIKASSVLLGCQVDPKTISARNILTGIVSSVIHGVVNDEVTIDLPGGSSVTSTITSASVKRLDIAVGKELSAIIKASDVLLAVA